MNKEFLKYDEKDQMEIIQNILKSSVGFDLTYIFVATKYIDIAHYIMDNYLDNLDKDALKYNLDNFVGTAPLRGIKYQCYKKLLKKK
jgi:hypothetical protein